MSDYPESLKVRPLQKWPGEQSLTKVFSSFSASLDNTLELLDRELRQVGAEDAELQVAIPPGQFRQDGRPNKRAVATHPGVVLTFTIYDGGDTIPVSFPCDRYWDWRDNLRAVALSMEALRKVDRYGVTKRSEQYRGFAALPAATGETMDREVARAFIERHGGSYREAAKRLHPDAGGSTEDFQTLQIAQEVLSS